MSRMLGELSVVGSRSEVVVLRCYCWGWEVVVEDVSHIHSNLVKELLVRCSQQLIERRQIRRAVAASLAAEEEGVDSLPVGRLDEARPGAGCV